ncbi:response regulator [Hydrogenophaga sp. NH-16]|uniref:response regulator n=1 Tax=Hydrogenophaga sp. NH-16 TaxID=2184519 RepID=UPI0013E3E33D|nr:response regulator [Hydrogenophaga sp. NH-16]
MKILIVDDDEISRVPLESLIQRLPGVTGVVEAADGEAAWALLQDGLRPSLCCCDLSMPNLDGVGLLKRAKGDQLLSAIPFVMISSAADRQSVLSAIEAGAVGFIIKPFSFADTTRTLERILRETQTNLVEPLGQIARRLGLPKSEVIRLMRKLQSDISACVGRVQTGSDASTSLAEIQRIQGSCALLGLKHCSTLLRTCVGEATSGDEALVIFLREVNLQVTLVIESATQEV